MHSQLPEAEASYEGAGGSFLLQPLPVTVAFCQQCIIENHELQQTNMW